MNFCKQANAIASSLKFKVKNGAHNESRPCQYTKFLLADTQDFNNRRSFSCPVEEANN